MSDTRMSRWWLIGGGIALVALVVASVAVALTERETPLAEGTPEAAVQRFLKAIEAKDYREAHGLLAEELRQACPVEEMAARGPFGGPALEDTRVTLDDTQLLDGAAVVTARVTYFYTSDPFGSSESSHLERFALRKESDGQWRFTQYPFPVYGCAVLKPGEPGAPVRPAVSPEPTSTATPAP